MESGEHWAIWRSKQWLEVTVMSVGEKKVRVEYVNEAREGERAWVKPKRLACRWSDLPAFEAAQRADERVLEASHATQAESWAYLEVLDCMPRELIDMKDLDAGTALVFDLAGLGRFLHLDPVDILGQDPAAERDGTLHVSQPITERIARAAAPLLAAPILQSLLREERDHRLKSVRGYTYVNALDGELIDVRGAEAAEDFREQFLPAHVLVRTWIGAQASDRADELEALRQEVARVAQIAHHAIRDLKSLRSNTTAQRLEEALLNPTPTWMVEGLTQWEFEEARQHLYRYRWAQECTCQPGRPGRPPVRGTECMTMTDTGSFDRVLPPHVHKERVTPDRIVGATKKVHRPPGDRIPRLDRSRTAGEEPRSSGT